MQNCDSKGRRDYAAGILTNGMKCYRRPHLVIGQARDPFSPDGSDWSVNTKCCAERLLPVNYYPIFCQELLTLLQQLREVLILPIAALASQVKVA